eukprot:GHVU01011788.1.p2 GENE.GHVU01011788.1~~GHVU01011788.1.p2  ORF type:complete len:176 (-),score=26.31 GHVU01011788.1:570-1097(-)
MLGFSPFDSSTEDSGVRDEDVDTGGAIATSTAPPQMGPGSDPKWLHDVNDYLKAYSDIDAKIHSWVVLEPPSLELVYRWRLQQEQQPREGEGEVEISTSEEGGGNRRRLTEAEVEDFVNRFMPAYQRYHPQLCSVGPKQSEGSEESLFVRLDDHRRPTAYRLTNLHLPPHADPER